MQFLEQFFSADSASVRVSSEQGSAFAKQVAGDFNPIHDVGSKRFCVPGDLLFAMALGKYGLSQSMSFSFLDMVKADSLLTYPESLSGGVGVVSDQNGKDVLSVEARGDCTQNSNSIETLLRQYVAFSGHNFPHILVPLMEECNVMINPARPLVIYQSMSFELQSLEFQELEINLTSSTLNVDGKRGDAILNFSFSDAGVAVGHGMKKLVLSGLRPFEPAVIEKLCEDYLAVANTVP